MRHEVERANSTRLAALQSPPVSYEARDSGSATPDKRKAVLAGMMVPERLVLKKAAQVMLVKNVDDQRGLVNGAVGRVLGFFAAPRGKSEGVVRNVKLSEDGKSVVFQSDGKENVKPNTGTSSSSSSTNNTKIEAEKPKSAAAADVELFPLVEFLTPLGRETVLVTRDEFRVEDNEGNVLARRVQASAISFFYSPVFSLLRVRTRTPIVIFRFLSSLHGPFPSTRARARPYSASRSILARCLRRVRVMSRCLALRLWKVCKSSGLILRRCVFFRLLSSPSSMVHGPTFTIVDTPSSFIVGLCAPQSHRMEQIVRKSHDLIVYDTITCIMARHTHIHEIPVAYNPCTALANSVKQNAPRFAYY